MKHDELMELAKQAGFLIHPKNTYIISPHGDANEDLTDELARFFRLAYARGMLKQEAQTMQHWSDCAVHSEPAYPAGECDCGGFSPIIRAWVGLTDKDMTECIVVTCNTDDGTADTRDLIRAVEAKLKEKNT